MKTSNISRLVASLTSVGIRTATDSKLFGFINDFNPESRDMAVSICLRLSGYFPLYFLRFSLTKYNVWYLYYWFLQQIICEEEDLVETLMEKSGKLTHNSRLLALMHETLSYLTKIHFMNILM